MPQESPPTTSFRRSRALVPLAALLVALAVAPSTALARGFLIGTSGLTADTPSCRSAFFGPVHYLQSRVPGGNHKARHSGRVKKWRVALSEASTLRLQVFKRVNGGFKVLRQTKWKSRSPGRHRFRAGLRIRKGQFVGLKLKTGCISNANEDAGRTLGFFPGIGKRETAAPNPSYSTNDRTLQYNARVRF